MLNTAGTALKVDELPPTRRARKPPIDAGYQLRVAKSNARFVARTAEVQGMPLAQRRQLALLVMAELELIHFGAAQDVASNLARACTGLPQEERRAVFAEMASALGIYSPEEEAEILAAAEAPVDGEKR